MSAHLSDALHLFARETESHILNRSTWPCLRFCSIWINFPSNIVYMCSVLGHLSPRLWCKTRVQSTALCGKRICTAISSRSRPSNNISNSSNPKISAYKTAVSASLNLRYKHLSKSFLWRQLTLTWASATLFTHSNHLSNKSVALTILISINLYRPFTYLQQIDYFANYRTMP